MPVFCSQLLLCVQLPLKNYPVPDDVLTAVFTFFAMNLSRRQAHMIKICPYNLNPHDRNLRLEEWR